MIFRFQSETCGIDIPELECEIGASGLGGRFTTIEGILNAIKEQLIESSAIFHDSSDVETKAKMDKYERNTVLLHIAILFMFCCCFISHY